MEISEGEFYCPKKLTEKKRLSTPRLSIVSFSPIGINIDKLALEAESAKHGLGVITAAIFLAGEMAGSGVLAIPNAMIGTGWGGAFIILMFTVNACFSGTRLGLCWVILEERYEEFQKQIRDPYPSIGEKAVGTWGRVVSVACICFTLYGAGCVFMVLIAQLLGSLLEAYTADYLSLCEWLVLVALFLIPLTWLGSPKDFWLIAVGALCTTVTACTLIIVQALLDYSTVFDKYANASNEMSKEELYSFAQDNYTKFMAENGTCDKWSEMISENLNSELPCPVVYPSPTAGGTFKAFASIMFAFAGASTFPTIQADMKDKAKFNKAAYIACIILGIIYVPMGVVGYYALGSHASPNVVISLSPGPVRITIEIMLLLHLVAAFPIIINPPCQYFEQLLKIPHEFNWRRCAFRSFSVLILLFVAESIPSFGSILDLVGSCSVTLLTFVFPPYFYMKLCDSSSDNNNWEQRIIPKWQRAYCWILITVGIIGGASSTYTAIRNVVSEDFQMPCYLLTGNNTVAVSSSH